MILPTTTRTLPPLLLALGLAAPPAFARLQATSVLLPAAQAGPCNELRIAADDSSPIRAVGVAELRFAVQELPADARIGQVTLRLTSTGNNGNPQLVRLFTDSEGQGDSLAKWTALPGRTAFTAASEALRRAVADRHGAGRPLTLWLRTGSRLSDWRYASTCAYGGDTAARPRLVVAYERDLAPPAATDRTSWRFHGDGNGVRVVPIRPAETLLSKPVFYGDSLFLFAKPDATHTQLLALNFNGRERWRTAIRQAPGGQVSVDADGSLFAVGRERVARYDLKRRGALSSSTGVQDLKPTVAPTLGLDDSLYAAVYGHLYGLNPRLQEVWRYPREAGRNAAFSPVVLSPDGQGRAHLLARLDNRNVLAGIDTGSGQWQEQPFDDRYGDFHTPVVVPDPAGDFVCLAANAQQDGLLSCHAGGQGIWSRNGPVSQPLASTDGERLYLVQNGCLWALDRRTGRELASSCGDGLAATSNLVVDGDSRITFWNNGTLLGFDRDCNPLGTWKLPGLPESLQLLFAPDGTLYAVNPKSRQLAMLLPARDALTLGQDDLQPHTVYAADRLRIAANTRLGAHGDIVLKAREGIGIGRGFAVERGGRVSFKTGF